MATVPRSAAQTARQTGSGHESFLRHARFRWLKVSAALSLVALIGYVAADTKPRPSGNSVMGYTLGTIGALLIVWLTLLGVRKRAMTRGAWSLKGWTSAHVYLGLSLVVIGTLHTGFQFGWNVHTLAYGLMMLVIGSGIFGVIAYATLPAALSQNREELTQAQMIEGLEAIDRQLNEAAQSLPREDIDLVLRALADSPLRGGLRVRLASNGTRCETARAIARLGSSAATPERDRTMTLLIRRKSQLDRMRRHLRIKALLEVWLYLHIPATFALLAALTAHIVSVFYYW